MTAYLIPYCVLGTVCGMIVADEEAQSFREYVGLLLFGAIVGTPCLMVAIAVIGWQGVARRFSPARPTGDTD